MDTIRTKNEPKAFLGESIVVVLKEGGKFNFKVTAAGDDYMSGYDDEGMNLRIDANDIDHVIRHESK